MQASEAAIPSVGEVAPAVAVAAAGLAAAHGPRTVWSGATFAIPAGSFTAVLGPNGAGKSTLIQLLLGRLRPAAGRLEVLGAAPRRGNPALGYVPQAAAADQELPIRGRDLVGLGLDGHRWGLPLARPGGRRRSAAITEALAAVGALPYAGRPISQLSGGERQRLVLAQALAGRPRLLLLDEPLSNLDLPNQRSIVGLLAGISRERGLTVVLVAHDVNPLLPFVDQVLYVARGRLAAGAPGQVITSAGLSRIYGAPVEVLRDSRGRLFVVGLEEEVSHPHGL